MTLKIFTLVCLFIIRLRFPPNKSIASIIRTRYGEATLKNIRKFEKADFRIRKTLLDINFLETCKDADVFPRFLQFKKSNPHLKKSTTYKECQKLLLQQEIDEKQKQLKEYQKNFNKLKSDLHGNLSYFDYLHITSLFFEPNVKTIETSKL